MGGSSDLTLGLKILFSTGRTGVDLFGTFPRDPFFLQCYFSPYTDVSCVFAVADNDLANVSKTLVSKRAPRRYALKCK